MVVAHEQRVIRNLLQEAASFTQSLPDHSAQFATSAVVKTIGTAYNDVNKLLYRTFMERVVVFSGVSLIFLDYRPVDSLHCIQHLYRS